MLDEIFNFWHAKFAKLVLVYITEPTHFSQQIQLVSTCIIV